MVLTRTHVRATTRMQVPHTHRHGLDAGVGGGLGVVDNPHASEVGEATTPGGQANVGKAVLKGLRVQKAGVQESMRREVADCSLHVPWRGNNRTLATPLSRDCKEGSADTGRP